METAKKISVYQNISQIAQRKKISINSIEKQASLSRGSICKWNVVNPSASSLKRVADILECTVDELLTECKSAEKDIV